MAKDKSEKKEKKVKKLQGDEPAAAEDDDVEMADISEVSVSPCTFLREGTHVHILSVPEKIEEGERNRHSVRRFVSSCATASA